MRLIGRLTDGAELARGSGDSGRVRRALGMLAIVTVLATAGYVALGLPFLDAVYQTIITISTVGYEAIGDQDDDQLYRGFTILVILAGVGTTFYTVGVLLELLIEGTFTDHLWRRRMQREIAEFDDHVIVCGWGRVGRTIAGDLARAGRPVVVIEHDPERVPSIDVPFVAGDATDDAVLAAAGLDRAGALIAALATDADNLYITLSGRSARPDLFIVARARVESAEPKLTQAGANRVVNPQHIGGERIAAMVLQPSVADFLDVVMHDRGLEFRLSEVAVPEGSSVAGASLRDAHLRDRTGALVLAMGDGRGGFRTNPPPDTVIEAGEILIAIGTAEQLSALRGLVTAH